MIDMENRKKCAIRLKNALNECGVKQKELAEKTGINVQYLNDMCNGKRPISEYNAKLIVKYLNEKHEPQKAEGNIYVGELDDDSREKYIGEGFQITDIVNSINYYNYLYFIGKMDYPNSEIANSASATFDSSFNTVVHDFMRLHGYEIISPDSFAVPLTARRDDETIKNIISVFPGLADDSQFLRIKELKSGKTLSLSYLDLMILFRNISHTIDQFIESEFLRSDLKNIATDTKKAMHES